MSHKRLLYCVKVNYTSLDHLLLGENADIDKVSSKPSITRNGREVRTIGRVCGNAISIVPYHFRYRTAELGRQSVDRRQRVDCGGIGDSSQVDVFVWAMGDGEQSRSIGISRNALRDVETDLEKPRTHLKARGFSRDELNVVGQGLSKRGVFA